MTGLAPAGGTFSEYLASAGLSPLVEMAKSGYLLPAPPGVMPNPQATAKLSWAELRATLPRANQEPAPAEFRERVAALDRIRSKKEFETLAEDLFPWRAKLDRGIRRCRLLDGVRCLRTRDAAALATVWSLVRPGWDQVWLLNIIVATLVYGSWWLDRMTWLGVFTSGLEHFTKACKAISDKIKTAGVQDPLWLAFVECQTLAGFRNPPFPGFDVHREAERLASGGEEHDYFGQTWPALCREALPMPFRRVKWRSFEEFVRSGDWSTAGSSTIGTVEVDIEGVLTEVRARKNMVPDVVDLNWLTRESARSRTNRCSAIVKAEPGKIRIAVTSPITTYLVEAYVDELMGGASLRWPGSTMNESFEQSSLRLAEMLKLCSEGFGLPFDFAEFDHQPTTLEQTTLVRLFCDHARLNVPPHYYREFDTLCENLLEGFRSSTLVSREGRDVREWKVTGGLLSGRFFTSKLGNAWNTVMGHLVLKLLRQVGVPTAAVRRYVRGDDSAIFCPDWPTAALIERAYAAVKVRGGVGKFSILFHQMEFLRSWFTTRVAGYPNRTIVSLTQRKPWSNEPWAPDQQLRGMHDAVRTLRRRWPSDGLEAFWRLLRAGWCRDKGLPIAVCWVPQHRGGFGIEPPPPFLEGSIVPPVPRAPTLDASVKNQTGWRAQKIIAYARDKYQLDASSIADALALDALLGTVSADGVRAYAKEARSAWLQAVRALAPKAKVTRRLPPVLTRSTMFDTARPHAAAAVVQALRARAPLYGAFPQLAQVREDWSRFRSLTGDTLTRWIEKYLPAAAVARRRFARGWYVGEIWDYLEGKVAIACGRIHPELAGVVSLVVAGELLPRRVGKRGVAPWYGGLVEKDLFQSPVSRLLYMW